MYYVVCTSPPQQPAVIMQQQHHQRGAADGAYDGDASTGHEEYDTVSADAADELFVQLSLLLVPNALLHVAEALLRGQHPQRPAQAAREETVL